VRGRWGAIARAAARARAAKLESSADSPPAGADAADAIVEHVSSILGVITAEFSAAAADMLRDGGAGARWTGLPPEARHRVAASARDAVRRADAAFAAVRAELDAAPGAGLTAAGVAAALAAEEAEARRLEALADALEAAARAGAGAHGGGGGGGGGRGGGGDGGEVDVDMAAGS